VTPDVGKYVIETAEMRIELEDILPISDSRSFDATVKTGDSVTFALEKNTVYVRNADATEHRLRVTKKTPRKRVR